MLKQLRPTPTAETVDGTSRVTWDEGVCTPTGLVLRVTGNCGVPGAWSFVGACGAGSAAHAMYAMRTDQADRSRSGLSDPHGRACRCAIHCAINSGVQAFGGHPR